MKKLNLSQIPEISSIMILPFSEFFWHFFSKYQDGLSFPEHFCEIPAKFHQNFAENLQNSSKNANEK
jgi:hypothetical protein